MSVLDQSKKMKCLICEEHHINENFLKNHYILHNRINPKNFFFKALFEKYDEDFSIKKCYRCDYLIISRSKEIQHNFLNHYQNGGEIPLENRVFTRKSSGTIIKFLIDYNTHKNSYDFEDPVKLLELLDFIKSSLKYDIKKKIIVNATTGSSWRFNRFDFVSVTFNTDQKQKISRH